MGNLRSANYYGNLIGLVVSRILNSEATKRARKKGSRTGLPYSFPPYGGGNFHDQVFICLENLAGMERESFAI